MLRVLTPDQEAELLVRVVPRQEKLDEEAWQALLDDLDGWLAGLSVGLEGPRHGSVGQDGVAAPLLAEALCPLLPLVERAFGAVLEQPRLRQTERWQDVPIRSARRVDRETLAWLGRHHEVGRWLDPWLAAELTRAEPSVPQREIFEDHNHPANRYIAWLLGRVERVLRETAAALGRLQDDDEGWHLVQGSSRRPPARGGPPGDAAPAFIFG